MIWFNLKEMERRISTNDISEKESVNYYLAIFIITTIYITIIAIRASFKSPVQVGPLSILIHSILNVAIFLGGILYIYKLNSENDNKDFFKRYFSVSFVIFIRMIVYTISIGLVLLIFISLFFSLQDMQTNFFNYIWHILKIVFYILVALSFKRISKKKHINTNESY